MRKLSGREMYFNVKMSNRKKGWFKLCYLANNVNIKGNNIWCHRFCNPGINVSLSFVKNLMNDDVLHEHCPHRVGLMRRRQFST